MKNLKNYILFIIIIIIIIIITFVLINSISNNKETTKETITNITKEKNIPNGTVGIVSHKYIGYGQIEVIIKNNTGKELEQVKVTAHCWDKNGNNIGDTSNGQNNVNTTDTYKIILFAKSNLQKYELELSY